MITLNGKQINSTAYVADKELRDGLVFQAQMAAKAGALPPGVDNAEGYITLVLGGIDLGLHPTRATSTLHLLGGRISLSAQAMVGLAYRDAGVTMEVEENTDQTAIAIFRRDGWPEHRTEFSIEHAKKAGLYPGKEKSGWAKYTKDMLLARVITRGLRYIAADAVTGIYSVEELNDGIETVELSNDLRAKYDAQHADLNELAAAAVVQTAPVAAPQAPKPEIKPKTTATASQFMQQAPGSVTAAKLDLTPEKEIELALKGGEVDSAVTSKNIMAAMKRIHGSDAQAKGVLQEKVKSYGVANSKQLSPIDFIDLYRWAAGEVRKFEAQLAAAEQAAAADAHMPAADPEVAEPLPESDPAGSDVPAFDPHRGAGENPASLGDLNDKIMAIWHAAAAEGTDEPINEIFDELGYDTASASPQLQRLVLERLEALSA